VSSCATCNYEGSRYQTEFWTADREYENLAERAALRKLLPQRGARLIEIGAGFGRLADLYAGYEQVVLLDYAKSQLRQAQERLRHADRFIYIAGDFYNLPLTDAAFDTAVTVRVLHHLSDVPRALTEVARILVAHGTYVLEYANKRHLKAIARYLLHRQSHDPFSLAPYEFAALNFDFSPAWMQARLGEAGFAVRRQLAVSQFRWAPLKRLVGARILARLDSLWQGPGARWQLSPSLFVQARGEKSSPTSLAASIFRCPVCHGVKFSESPQSLTCRSCSRLWPIDDGIYDFKT